MPEVTKSLHHRVATELPEAPPRLTTAPPSPEVPAPSPPAFSPKVTFVIVVGAAILTLAVWVVARWRTGEHAGEASPGQRTATVERRDFLRTLRISGTLQAVQSYVITAPEILGQHSNQLTITKLAPGGARVKAGDLLVEFDRQGQIQDFLDRQAEYRDLVDQIAKKQADEATARAKDDTELQQAEDDLAKAKLEMLKNEIVSRIDAEKNRLTLDETTARVKALRSTYDLKRKAAQADIRDLEIQRDAKQSAMLHAQQNEGKMSIRSPVQGIAVLKSIWKGGQMAEVEEGDQVWTGLPILQVVNPATMEVRANVDQVDVPDLRVGQTARIELDAYPGAVFAGKLDELAPVGVASEFSDKLEQFAATFSLEGSDSRLMPDLSAAVDVELRRVPGALVVPRDALLAEGSHMFARLRQGSGFEKREVKIGPLNDTEAVVESGLDAGDVVERDP
ncbi:MAG TPA: HlyD family efflux transporter periplasmic adaptor subunit [Terriglobia bacterium]|nr:HlyD family efflux transporter periplasmic adaptor subunit [Terriglobia bacterium]